MWMSSASGSLASSPSCITFMSLTRRNGPLAGYRGALVTGRWSSVESVVELVGELVVFSPVSFTHGLSHPAQGAPGGRPQGREEEERPVSTMGEKSKAFIVIINIEFKLTDSAHFYSGASNGSQSSS